MIGYSAVTKRYAGWRPGRGVTALEDLTLEMNRGEVFGIAGPNGAGKSTMLSLALGFLAPTAGAVHLAGEAPRRYVERVGVAYLSELVAIPPAWTAESALHRYGVLAGLSTADRKARVARAIEQLELGTHAAKKIKQLSKGTLQRLGLAQALLSQSELVIFDEPTHGLDPLWTQRFRDIVRELRRPDRLIVIASHNLDELERLADRVGILDRGRLQRVAGGEPSAAAAAGPYRLILSAPCPGIPACFADAQRDAGARGEEWIVRGDLAQLNSGLARLIREGGSVLAFYPEQSRLETAFREAVRGAGGGA
ncbi:MAG: ABC transporter ATP-binding protein [Gemmatimonadales bacterium]